MVRRVQVEGYENVDLNAEEFTVDLKGCARCGETHGRLVFIALASPGLVWGIHNTHWATCPVTDEPIMFYWRESD